MSYRSVHPMFVETFDKMLGLEDNFVDTLWNYMAYGLEPGSLVKHMICEDYGEALESAHPGLSVQVLKDMKRWFEYSAPIQSYGSQTKYNSWRAKTDEERRDIMIECELRPSVMQILKGEQIA